MGSNTGSPFDYSYSAVFDDDYDADDDGDIQEIDTFIASLPPYIDPVAAKAFIIEKANNLSYIIRIQNGIHHIAQILNYNGLRIRLELNNTDWEMPNEIVASPVYKDDMQIHYLPHK